MTCWQESLSRTKGGNKKRKEGTEGVKEGATGNIEKRGTKKNSKAGEGRGDREKPQWEERKECRTPVILCEGKMDPRGGGKSAEEEIRADTGRGRGRRTGKEGVDKVRLAMWGGSEPKRKKKLGHRESSEHSQKTNEESSGKEKKRRCKTGKGQR